MNPGNLPQFEYVFKHLPTDDPMLEIGSFCGLSTNIIGYMRWKHKQQNLLFCSDKWEFENLEDDPYLENSQVRREDFRNYVQESFERNVKTFFHDDPPHAIKEFSDDFFKLWGEKSTQTDIFDRSVELGGPLSFVFIDGNHTYSFAKRDFENADKFLVKNGFILFDDSASYLTHFGVYPVVKEALKSKRYKLVSANPNHLLQKIAD